MVEPIENFCDMIDALPDEAGDLIWLTSYATGLKYKPSGVEQTRDTPMGDLYLTPTVDEVRSHLGGVVGGVIEEVLVQGLLHFIMKHYEKLADPGVGIVAAKNHVDVIEDFEDMLNDPGAERPPGATDEELRAFIAKLKGMLSDLPGRAPNHDVSYRRLQAESAARFNDEYWSEWRSSRIRRRL